MTTKEAFLTVRWNNLLSIVLGLPGLVFILYAYSNTTWTSLGGMIGISAFGVVY